MPTPAIVEITETNGNLNGGSGSISGNGPVVTDGITNLNFGSADAPNLNTLAHPIVLSVSAISYSVTKWLQFHLVNLGTSTSVGNLRVWKLSGAYLTKEFMGTTCWRNDYFVNVYGGTSGGNPSTVPCPYSGDGHAVLGAARTWDDGTFAIPTSLPASNFLTINSGSQAAVLTVGGQTGGGGQAKGYSDFCVIASGGNGQGGSPTPPSSVTPPNQKVIAFTYDENP